MGYFIAIFIFFVFIIFLFLISNIRVEITYRLEKLEDELTLFVKALFGIIRFKKNMSFLGNDKNQKEEKKGEKASFTTTKGSEPVNDDKTAEALQSVSGVKEKIDLGIDFLHVAKEIMAKVKIVHFEWRSVLGTGDAASTGIASGIGWGIKGSTVGVISQLMQLIAKPQINIIPNFNHPVSNTFFKCMLKVRLGHAILAGIKLILFWRRNLSQTKVKNSQSGHRTL